MDKKRNYQLELEKIIEKNEMAGTAGEVPTLLLHACCAPCSSHCLEFLCRYFRVTVFYYNPNISLGEEYLKRVAEEKRLIAAYNQEMTEGGRSGYLIGIIEGKYEPERFYQAVKGLEKLGEGSERCFKCFELRLREAAEIAAGEKRYDYFSTTLTISPLKNAAKLNEIGEALGNEYGIKWLPSDFKKKDGYKRSIELSDIYGLYRQDYCGCSFSKAEREQQKQEEKKSKKKLVIIGGGVAGLSAGIFGQRAGFDTVIYEKNNVAGGSCSGWFRDGYAIDNCLHWLTGSKPGNEVYDTWKELGVINDNTKFIRRDWFWSSEYEGVRVTLWPDSERTRKELLEIAPEDEKEINAFIDFVSILNDALNGSMNVRELYGAMGSDATTLNRKQFILKAMQYLGLKNTEWVKRFKNPAIRNLILDFCPKEYESYWLLLSYSFYVSGNADIIEGGSIQIARSLMKTYKKAGGTLKLGTPVKKVVIGRTKLAPIELVKEGFAGGVTPKASMEVSKEIAQEALDELKEKVVRKAIGVILESGESLKADYIICACDINYAFNNLISRNYAPISLKEIYNNHINYTFYSAFQVAFAVKGEFEEVPDSLSFACMTIEAGYEKYDRIGVKNYRRYGDYIAPKGETVIQVSLDQYEKDCEYWEKLYISDKDRYDRTKENIALAIKNAIIERFPQYEDRLTLLDVWTPYSYLRRNNDTHGAFMRFITTALSVNAFLSQEINGLDNVYLAGHWLKYPGGLPTAAGTGKEAVRLIKEKEDRRAEGLAALIPFKPQLEKMGQEVQTRFNEGKAEVQNKFNEGKAEVQNKFNEGKASIKAGIENIDVGTVKE